MSPQRSWLVHVIIRQRHCWSRPSGRFVAFAYGLPSRPLSRRGRCRIAIESRARMKIGLRDIEPNIARRIREMLDYMRTIGFEHPHTPERDAQLAARTVLQRKDTVPHVVRLASSV